MSLLDELAKRFGQTDSSNIGRAIEQLVDQAVSRRRPHERRWYDNNFFDDGYHFRTISRKTGRVLDHTQRQSSYTERAIPRASRQIRGVSNLLFAAEPYPVVYPKRVSIEQFRDKATGQVNVQAYQQALEQNKQIARKQGIWLSTEWEDEQQLPLKLIDMILLAAKNSVSWLQVYSNTEKQKICTEVFDAFDVICFGDERDHNKLPFITKTRSRDINKVKNDPMFDPAMASKLTPDNKYATSEVKDAYMRTRFGVKQTDGKDDGTIIEKETFMQEVLSEDNWKNAMKLGERNGAMEGKSIGDTVMRHVFSAGGITLKDEYVDYDSYPLVPLRFEPGPIYQVPFIERFIPQNKSLDIIVTRLEKWVNAMVVGVYQKRKGENYQVSNFPGGQLIEYETGKLDQMQVASVGQTPFAVVDLLNKYIDEQGATTAGGQNLPSGVKSGVAIESVKATEYANLKIPTMMLKQTIKGIAERMLERAHKDFLQPVEVESLEDGEPNYFDVIGQRGYDLSQKVNKALPSDVVVLDKSTKVRIEIEPGLGLTMEGKRQAMETVIGKTLEFMKFAPGSIPPEAFQMMIKRFLETFGWGSTQELMEAMETGLTAEDITEEQLTKMKVAILEALRDSGAVGKEMEERLVDSTKVGVLEALKDTGMLDKDKEGMERKEPSKSISFKDLPPDGKAQLARQAGIQLNPAQIAADEQMEKRQEAVMKEKEIQLKEKSINQKAKSPKAI